MQCMPQCICHPPARLTISLFRNDIQVKFTECGPTHKPMFATSMDTKACPTPLIIMTHYLSDHVLVGFNCGLSMTFTVDTVHEILSVDTVHAMPPMYHDLIPLLDCHYLHHVGQTCTSQPWHSVYKFVFVIAPASFFQVIHRLIFTKKVICFRLNWDHLHINISAGLRWLVLTHHFSCNDVESRVLQVVRQHMRNIMKKNDYCTVLACFQVKPRNSLYIGIFVILNNINNWSCCTLGTV